MPIIKSAQKRLKQTATRTDLNDMVRHAYKDAVRHIKSSVANSQKVTPKALQTAYSSIDKAAKARVIHDNKASRLKSRITKLVQKTQ